MCEPVCSRSSTGHGPVEVLGKQVGDANTTDESGLTWPREIEVTKGECPTIMISSLLLNTSTSTVEALPKKIAEAVPPPTRLRAGQADGPWAMICPSLAAQRSGTLVS